MAWLARRVRENDRELKPHGAFHLKVVEPKR